MGAEVSSYTSKSNNQNKKRKWSLDNAYPLIILIPSIIAITIFVYGFIAWTGFVSLTKWRTLKPDFTFVGLQNYINIFHTYRFQADLRNLLVFTVLFIFLSIVIGMSLALLVDQKVRFEGFFRSVFIFPMAVSFIVTGVAWQWILNPAAGVNILLKHLGFSHVPNWYVSTNVIPQIHIGQIQFGIPVALIAIVIAAIWQMSGFAMALYLSGLRSIPNELREAARVDGAGAFTIFWKIVLPQLRPITVTVVIILSYISMRIFDLVYAMTGPGAAFVTDMPSMNMYYTTFRGNNFAEGAAISVVMVLVVAVFVIPYLMTSLKQED